MAAQHEFSDADAAVFADLGRWVLRASALLGVLAGLIAVLGAEAWWALTRRGPDGAFLGILGLAGFVLAAVLGYTAVRLRGAALRLRAVATTAGDDVSHLTAALEGLGATFGLLLRAIAASGALALLALLAHHGHSC